MQSISSWAPSCIGPYAQAVSASGLTHFAGQIGLDPPTMSLVQGGPEPQAVRSLRSCQAVSVAAKADLQRAQLGCTIYAAAEASSQCHADSSGHSAGMEPAASRPAVTKTFSHIQRILSAYQREGLPNSVLRSKQHAGQLNCGSGHSDPSQTHEYDRRTGESSQHVSQNGMLEQHHENLENGEDSGDAYLRPPVAPARVPAALLTYVEAAALPKGATVELQPLALHTTWQGGNRSDALLTLAHPPRSWQLAMQQRINADCLRADPSYRDILKYDAPTMVVAGEADLEHIIESFPPKSAPGGGCSGGPRCMTGVCLEAVASPGRLCYAQLSLGQDEGEASSSAVAQGMASALGRAQLSAESIEGIRVDYSVTRLSRDRAADLVQHALEELKVSWAPVMVPVLAVGMTPAADAALHLVWLGMQIIPG